jgi:hypothetical protein
LTPPIVKGLHLRRALLKGFRRRQLHRIKARPETGPGVAKGAQLAFGGDSGAGQDKNMHRASRHIPAVFATLTPSFLRQRFTRNFNYRLTI